MRVVLDPADAKRFEQLMDEAIIGIEIHDEREAGGGGWPVTVTAGAESCPGIAHPDASGLTLPAVIEDTSGRTVLAPPEVE
jgi:hypothetical protein